jgi:hypothetical protein
VGTEAAIAARFAALREISHYDSNACGRRQRKNPQVAKIAESPRKQGILKLIRRPSPALRPAPIGSLVRALI